MSYLRAMYETVGSLGEAGVLAKITAPFVMADAVLVGPGDDCAVLQTRGEVVVTSDTMIERMDFRFDWHEPEELGWKLAATNLSDVAAMGAHPVALTVAVACPKDTPVAILEGVSRGLQRACEVLAPGCSIAGGDLAQASEVFFAVTAIGELRGKPAILRSGASVGDTVAYAGELGLSGLGLAALQQQGPMVRETSPREVRAHLTPSPPIEAILLAAELGATAMMDVSDGLSLDAARLGAASSVTVNFSSALLSRNFGIQDDVEVSVEAMLTGGEDHGFLATFSAKKPLPDGFFPIGEVQERSDVLRLDDEFCEPRGWDPYRS